MPRSRPDTTRSQSRGLSQTAVVVSIVSVRDGSGEQPQLSNKAAGVDDVGKVRKSMNDWFYAQG